MMKDTFVSIPVLEPRCIFLPVLLTVYADILVHKCEVSQMRGSNLY